MMEEKTPDADEIQSENLSIGPQPNKYKYEYLSIYHLMY